MLQIRTVRYQPISAKEMDYNDINDVITHVDLLSKWNNAVVCLQCLAHSTLWKTKTTKVDDTRLTSLSSNNIFNVQNDKYDFFYIK